LTSCRDSFVGVHERGQQRAQLFPCGFIAAGDLERGADVGGDRVDDHLAEQLLLVFEVVVERRPIDLELADDVVHPHSLEALVAEDTGGSVEQDLLSLEVGLGRFRGRRFASPADRAHGIS
jgi:hypothetical protein